MYVSRMSEGVTSCLTEGVRSLLHTSLSLVHVCLYIFHLDHELLATGWQLPTYLLILWTLWGPHPPKIWTHTHTHKGNAMQYTHILECSAVGEFNTPVMSCALLPYRSICDFEILLLNFNSYTATSPPPRHLQCGPLLTVLIWCHIQILEDLILVRYGCLTATTVKGALRSLWLFCNSDSASQDMNLSPCPFLTLKSPKGGRRVWEMRGQESAKQLCHWVSTHSEYMYGCRHVCAKNPTG